jgi:hypothetical protein
MPFLRNITSGLRSLFRKEQVSHELDEELNGFLEMAAEENEAGDEPKGCPSRGALGARQSRNYEGSRGFWRLGILRGDLLARFSLRPPHAAQIAWVHRRRRPHPRPRRRRQHRHLQLHRRRALALHTSERSATTRCLQLERPCKPETPGP